jgi:hypothetical protein
MGSLIEINDTLELTTEQGFPVEILDLEKHLKNPITLEDVKDKIFTFKDKPTARIYQLDPVRVYYAHNIDGKWLFWGRIFIQTETIYKKVDSNGNWTEGEWFTSGTYKIIDVYDPEYQKHFTLHEAPLDRNYFI